jgi:hypothetical protein
LVRFVDLSADTENVFAFAGTALVASRMHDTASTATFLKLWFIFPLFP